jgi:hypothetical protein
MAEYDSDAIQVLDGFEPVTTSWSDKPSTGHNGSFAR